MSKYFYHGLDSPGLVIKILKEGIKAKRLQGYQTSHNYNGLDYISLCSKRPDSFYTHNPLCAYPHYIYQHFVLIISGDIPAIKPIIVSPLVAYQELLKDDSLTPYSDMEDEYQVLNYIKPEAIIGIGIPFAKLKKKCFFKKTRQLLEETRTLLLLAQSLDLDIVDTSTFDFVEQYEEAKALDKHVTLSLNI